MEKFISRAARILKAAEAVNWRRVAKRVVDEKIKVCSLLLLNF
jgi:hypothetical protein